MLRHIANCISEYQNIFTGMHSKVNSTLWDSILRIERVVSEKLSVVIKIINIIDLLATKDLVYDMVPGFISPLFVLIVLCFSVNLIQVKIIHRILRIYNECLETYINNS